jgi:hypothetical protein
MMILAKIVVLLIALIVVVVWLIATHTDWLTYE